jgi:poly(A) polymerase
VHEVELLLSQYHKFREVFQMREATLQRFLREPFFDDLLALHRADASATDGNLAYYEFCLSRLKAVRAQAETEAAKLVDGTDLIQLGLKPGPEFSNILRVIEDLALEHKLKSKEEALEYVVKNFVK